VSKVALLVAVAFWTWLWGPVGLVLATPLTACLLVLAKYVPEMDFLAILVGEEPPLEPPVRYYQRLLAEDEDEASEIVEEFLRSHPVEQLFDDLLIPALATAKRDFVRHRLSKEGLEFIVRATYEIIQDLAPREAAAPAAAGSQPPEAAGSRTRVLGYPVKDKADELALEMFRQLSAPARFEVEVTSAEMLSAEIVAMVETSRPAVVILAALPPGGLAQARYLCKRLRARHPEVRILVGRWGHRDDGAQENWDVLLSTGADHVSRSLLETRNYLDQVASLQPPTAATPAGTAA
jgi:hypothetical protein